MNLSGNRGREYDRSFFLKVFLEQNYEILGLVLIELEKNNKGGPEIFWVVDNRWRAAKIYSLSYK
uniref:Uncharacterized protein n=1 Tax=Nelumbo nucifera TaxID=4432 RepID=A0A822YNG3_NELNU|nr:TPA_asm: hypothetical protein HUJ06_011396 [Nelumbo nucifera]